MIEITSTLIEHITDMIVERFHPRRIVLFGSQARGDARPDSDLDLFVEMESTLSVYERMRDVYALFSGQPWDIDVIVYTPEEVARGRNIMGNIVWIVEREGKVIHERGGDVEIRDSIESVQPQESWIVKAKNDLLSIENNLASESLPWDVVCFHAQQAAEKLLKAFLLFHGQLPPRTHNLSALLATAAEIDPALKVIESECSTLTPYAVAARYPLDPEPREKEGREAVAATHRIRDLILPRFRSETSRNRE